VQLIVAEKPSVARDLARVLGVRASGRHYFEGDDRVITWCIGHLVELDEPAAYDARWKAWRLDTLPMLPTAFRLRPAPHARDQLRAVTQLLADRRFTSVVNACDAGREGELIFRYLADFAGRHPPVRRLWISSLTDDAIRRGFAALRPAAQLDALGDAARARSEADWLVGMNATRAITVRGRAGGHSALYSIGRVQTPTLAMLVRREQEIRAFVPRPYWEIQGELTIPSGAAAGQRFSAGWRHGGTARLATAALAEAIAARDTARASAAHPEGPRVERLRARTVREPPPLLFDLTALQRTANRRFGFSAARTLALAQALYEQHKLLTYPRTDARHLSSDVAREMSGVFAALAEVPDYAAFAAPLVARPPRPGRRVVDDAKVRDHHAIIPTPKPAQLPALDRDERRLFDLVARRFLAAFYPDAEFAVTDVWIRVGAATGEPPPAFDADPAPGTQPRPAPHREAMQDSLPPLPDRYFARGRVRLVAGWQEVAGIDEPAGPISLLPALVEGQVLDGRFTPVAKQTTPPPHFSDATLLGAMESAGQTIDDDALRLAMKDRGLGTPATRAAIIETLVKRDYVVRIKQQLVPTALGVVLIETLPVASLASPELTGAWEARLARIARGEDSRAAFMADIARYVAETVDAIRGSAPPAAPVNAAASTGPEAGPEAATYHRSTRPSSGGHPSRRGARSPRTPRAPKLPRRTRASKPARGTRDVLDVELPCPRCQVGFLITGARGWGCSRWRDGCRFVIWFETAGRRLSAAQLRDLVTRGKTRKARFRTQSGAEIDGRLVLDLDSDGGSARLVPG